MSSSQVSDGDRLADRDEYAHLTVPELRRLRASWAADEEIVSYWRRLLHGRLDVLTNHDVSVTDLGRVLAGDQPATGSGAGPATVAGRVPAMPANLPGVPPGELEAVWVTPATGMDSEQVTELVRRVRAVERALGEHRAALHAALDTSAKALARRYVESADAAVAAFTDGPHRL